MDNGDHVGKLSSSMLGCRLGTRTGKPTAPRAAASLCGKRRPSTLSLGSCASSRSSLSPSSSSCSTRSPLTPGSSSSASTRSSLSPRASLSPAEQKRPLLPSGRERGAPALGNRPTKTVPASTKTCCVCRKPLTDAGCFALGKIYHTQCLKCGVCSARIESKFYSRGGKPCCPKCYKISPTAMKCRECSLAIQGDWVEVSGELFHPTCMRCYVCGEMSSESFFTYLGRPICPAHREELIPTCAGCGTKVTDGYCAGEKILCKACISDEADTCQRCGKEIKGESLGVGELTYHASCLTCCVCKEHLAGKPVSLDSSGSIYCTKDYDRKFAPTCYGCKKQIVPKPGQTTSSRLRALDKDFHLQCYKCQTCGLRFESGVRGRECYPLFPSTPAAPLFLCRKCKDKRECESE